MGWMKFRNQKYFNLVVFLSIETIYKKKQNYGQIIYIKTKINPIMVFQTKWKFMLNFKNYGLIMVEQTHKKTFKN